MSGIYTSIAEAMTAVRASIAPFLSSISTSPPSSGGHSLYDVKLHLLLQYLVRLLHVVRLKVSGASIETEESVDELTEIRIALERMRPLEKAVAYSVDKLLSTAAAVSKEDGAQGSRRIDARTYRPNAFDLLPVSAIPSSSSSSAPIPSAPVRAEPSSPPSSPPPSSPTHPTLYRPPHHVPTALAGSRRESSRASKARSSKLVESLYSSMSSRPEEIRQEGAGYGELNERAASDEERTEYEERMMVRLVQTKEDKRRQRERERRKALEDVEDFDELRRFIDSRDAPRDAADDEEHAVSAKRPRRGGAQTVVDDLFDGVERGARPRQRGKLKGKAKSSSSGKNKRKANGGGRRRR